MAQTREGQREYRRQRRAEGKDGGKPKTCPEPGERPPVVDAAMPRDALMNASHAEVAAVRAKLAARPDGVITKTGGRLDVISREAFKARGAQIGLREMMTAARPATPAPQLQTMRAVGGVAGRGLIPMGRGYPAAPDIAARQFERYEAMLGALAQRSDKQDREIAEQDRRIARLEERDGERSRVSARGTGIASAFGELAASFFEGMSKSRQS